MLLELLAERLDLNTFASQQNKREKKKARNGPERNLVELLLSAVTRGAEVDVGDVHEMVVVEATQHA